MHFTSNTATPRRRNLHIARLNLRVLLYDWRLSSPHRGGLFQPLTLQA
jgi:hypothetical protein